jgi:hypothetical protein
MVLLFDEVWILSDELEGQAEAWNKIINPLILTI